ncbi:helix-turn-helix domain-containing protein [Cohnella zeiphila]|uniref:Helix-turn-helix domain-containing protein n=1 Tax=Cohnella zeiphila TaxID=2761120 RepID=A0A7X0SJ28_9BACL|nr:helix-turn-helix domain-containing protein [Cohnella zeiphila]MBB6730910.1 helix-turn-helix domain-containing protein [Cohnella zeiphila]
MLNVMIVEDEMLVRLGFKNTVPWEKYGMSVCADAANGREAWELYNGGLRPDIIVTDLLMPEMDGLELIRRIRGVDSRTRIVILSCMEDFHLVRQAMNMGVSNYMLKLTMTAEEIASVLTQVKDELGVRESIEANKGIIRNPDYLKENVLKNYVFYQLYSEEEFTRHIAKLKLRLHPERLVVCRMEIDRFEQVREKFRDEKGELIRATILNVLNEQLDQSQRGEAISDGDRCYLLLFSFPDVVSEAKIHEELVWLLQQIQKVMKRFFNVSVTIGVSGIRNEYVSMKALYRESLEAAKRKFFHGTGHILFQLQPEREATEGAGRKLDELLGGGADETDRMRRDLKEIADKFVSSGQLRSEADVRKLFVRLLHAPAGREDVGAQEAAMLIAEYGEAIRKGETLDEICETFGRYLTELADMRGSRKRLSKEIAQAVQYVQEHHHTNISLPQLAEWLQLSPNYLSGLFKKELNVNFTDYVNRVRLEKAKELLLSTNLKSYEIAERTGFADDSYFSRMFLKHVGVRPNGFRRLWVHDRIAGGAGAGDGHDR